MVEVGCWIARQLKRGRTNHSTKNESVLLKTREFLKISNVLWWERFRSFQFVLPTEVSKNPQGSSSIGKLFDLVFPGEAAFFLKPVTQQKWLVLAFRVYLCWLFHGIDIKPSACG